MEQVSSDLHIHGSDAMLYCCTEDPLPPLRAPPSSTNMLYRREEVDPLAPESHAILLHSRRPAITPLSHALLTRHITMKT